MSNKVPFIIIIILTFITPYRSFSQDNDDIKWYFNNSKSLSELWELDDEHHRGTFIITSYKPIYLTAVKYSTDTNRYPVAENSTKTLDAPVSLNTSESKFQVSLKTKIFHKMFDGRMDLWMGYSQTAYWQIYNTERSRPFRELNYQPELIANFPVSFKFLGFDAKMIGASIIHESNGQSDPISRSWNRIAFHAAFEHHNWQVMLKPWIRLGSKIDDNENISDFMGRGEANIVYDLGRQRFRAIARHSLNIGNKSRGSLQFTWSFPIFENFNGHLQVFDGYGETLIDYNHRQTTFGIGVSLIN
ncbi:phospholipase A1 [Maribacter sedimenticola]|uniref:Phosphatidylcholine 1-acylhydrolase n=1 Tax=Maribacter sedimenticola TaxID=228956 RepID=A0ABY1SE54_9FLAO|nr:phospholipase A [Maribacter sedimenticola]SNR30336.1 phospholipase A1 [Maribacter sedimenticola]